MADKDPIAIQIIRAVDHTCEIFKRALNISLTDDEKYYICKMLAETSV